MPRRTRREILEGLAAAATLAGCAPEGPPAAATGRIPPGDTGSSGSAPRVPGDIDTIVICMMENRSFDHVFGSYSLVEGRSEVDGLLPGMGNADSSGRFHEVVPLTNPCTHPDPPHGWSTSRTQFGDGRNDGFVTAYETRGGSFDLTQCISWQSRAQQPVSYALADRFSLCQRWFSSVLSSTWPNRLYWHAATSQGVEGNDMPPEGRYTARTLWDQLDDAGIEWANYYTDLPTLALFARPDWAERLYGIDDFYVDAAAGTLPSVVTLDPGAASNDDHPPHHPLMGQLFIGSVVQALMDSPQWERTLFILTYDEAGGFYDHVPPGTMPDDHAEAGFDQLGFRVPSLVVGPWVREGYVSDTVFDHTAAMAFVREWFGIDEALTARDAASNRLSEVLDLQRMAEGLPRSPIQLPEVVLDEESIEAQCAARGWPTGQPELQQVAESQGLARPGGSEAMRRFFRRVGDQGLWVPARG
jgi:phospholipase C